MIIRNRSLKYRALIRKHKTHYWKLMRIIQRAKRRGLECEFQFDTESLQKFIDCIGPVPHTMKNPSVGRWNHSKGYVVGNFRWQELLENTIDGASRAGKISVRNQLARGLHPTQTGKSAFHTGAASRASTRSQLARGTHNSQTGKTGVHSGVVRRPVECPGCGKVGPFNAMKRWHFENCRASV